jgi:ferredoxin, 2Fe-2S
MIELKGQSVTKTVEAERGLSILDLAMKHHVDWRFSCTSGTCARCRCLVTAGLSLLSPPNDRELDRLEPEEIAEGYRLGCQAVIRENGLISAQNKTYF